MVPTVLLLINHFLSRLVVLLWNEFLVLATWTIWRQITLLLLHETRRLFVDKANFHRMLFPRRHTRENHVLRRLATQRTGHHLHVWMVRNRTPKLFDDLLNRHNILARTLHHRFAQHLLDLIVGRNRHVLKHFLTMTTHEHILQKTQMQDWNRKPLAFAANTSLKFSVT